MPTLASGSYTSRPPQPGAAGASVDRALYSLGQRIFTGKIKPDAAVPAEPQTERLERLQGVLPKRTAAKTDLISLAGKLSTEQLDALEYYVNLRYGK